MTRDLRRSTRWLQALYFVVLLAVLSPLSGCGAEDASPPAAGAKDTPDNPVATQAPVVSEARSRLDEAWSSFSQGMAKARNHLVDPESFPPEATERNLAEGHRYLLGHMGRLIEQEMRDDPRFPEFHRSMDMLRKHTGENPDAMYLKAPIDASGSYRVTGRAANTEEWRTSARTSHYPKAPRMVTFQTITQVPGGTGQLAEMSECVSLTLGFVNSFDLKLDGQGRFEILIAAERPEGYEGDFLPSRKEMECAANGTKAVREARHLSVREVFADWENEQPLELDIVRIDSIGANRPPITSDWMAERLESIGKDVPNHILFWSLLQEMALEVRRDVNGDGRRNLPVNGINPAQPPFTAGGAAGAKQLYASGVFELGPDQALLIHVATPTEPHYLGFQLNNFWMEGPDQQNYVSSLTGHQNPLAENGERYYVIAHRDPGIRGWVDTTGLEKGFHTMRFLYRDDVPEDQLPKIEAQLVPFAELESLLPAGLERVDAEQRRREIAIRQAHIKRRWRAF